MQKKLAKLALEDGAVFTGHSFGAEGEKFGEIVFNTSMTGYQEILTDPSYKGQIVTMTYPMIGNYGVNDEDPESQRPHVEGFVVRDLNEDYSNFRSSGNLSDYLSQFGIIGIQGIDTRGLVRRLRIRGAMRSILSTTDLDDASLLKKVRETPSMVGRDLVREVMAKEPFDWSDGFNSRFSSELLPKRPLKKRVTAIDFGMKWNILRSLVQVGCTVKVVPPTSSAEDILKDNPDGIFLSNGPGDPEAVSYGIAAVKGLIGKKPIFGICLGHQILSLALGAKTFKLRFGHRGANHPVKNLITQQVEITTQNHGFAVDSNSLPSDVEQTHVNLNDQTNEGLRHEKLKAFSVQYHPEACAGPHDSSYLFEEFRSLMD